MLSLIVGCGGPANKYDAVVTGTVTIDGELANSGIVTFHPVDDGKGRDRPHSSGRQLFASHGTGRLARSGWRHRRAGRLHRHSLDHGSRPRRSGSG